MGGGGEVTTPDGAGSLAFPTGLRISFFKRRHVKILSKEPGGGGTGL